MNFYAEKRDNIALKALKKRGMVMHILEYTDTFNEQTGQATEDTSPKSTKVYGLVLSHKKREGGVGSDTESSLAGRIVKKVMVSATGVKTQPTPDMILKIGTVEHEIISVAPFAPAGIDVFYDMQVAV